MVVEGLWLAALLQAMELACDDTDVVACQAWIQGVRGQVECGLWCGCCGWMVFVVYTVICFSFTYFTLFVLYTSANSTEDRYYYYFLFWEIHLANSEVQLHALNSVFAVFSVACNDCSVVFLISTDLGHNPTTLFGFEQKWSCFEARRLLLREEWEAWWI